MTTGIRVPRLIGGAVLITFALAIALTTSHQTAADAPASRTWSTAIKVPGMASLSTGGVVEVNSISCASAGNCSAGGYYQLRPFNHDEHALNYSQAFVVNETNGTWGRAIEVPGSAKLNAGRVGVVSSVSCGSVGNCSAGGYMYENQNREVAFVTDEADGSWGQATKVLASASLGAFGDPAIDAISCASAGNCSAGGTYWNLAKGTQAFVGNETNGTWRKASEVPGLARLDVGKTAAFNALSCASAGNCSVGGSYWGPAKSKRAFVANETNGTWSKATEVPGTSLLNMGGEAEVDTVSCASAGNCSAGGSYWDLKHHQQAFVANETNGAWDTAIAVPSVTALNTGGSADADLMSCRSNGNCSAGGYYAVGTILAQESFLVTEKKGVWAKAFKSPGGVFLHTISCWSTGNCGAGGNTSSDADAVTVIETNGTWGKAVVVAGLASLDTYDHAFVDAISCPSAGRCSAAGIYMGRTGYWQGFLVDEVR